MTPNMYMHVFSISVYSSLYLTTITKKSRLFSDACVKYEHPWSTATACLSIWDHIKNGRSLKKYSKFTPTIHINPNSYSFRIMFIKIIVRFFFHLLQWIKIWKVATSWDRVTTGTYLCILINHAYEHLIFKPAWLYWDGFVPSEILFWNLLWNLITFVLN